MTLIANCAKGKCIRVRAIYSAHSSDRQKENAQVHIHFILLQQNWPFLIRGALHHSHRIFIEQGALHCISKLLWVSKLSDSSYILGVKRKKRLYVKLWRNLHLPFEWIMSAQYHTCCITVYHSLVSWPKNINKKGLGHVSLFVIAGRSINSLTSAVMVYQCILDPSQAQMVLLILNDIVRDVCIHWFHWACTVCYRIFAFLCRSWQRWRNTCGPAHQIATLRTWESCHRGGANHPQCWGCGINWAGYGNYHHEFLSLFMSH